MKNEEQTEKVVDENLDSKENEQAVKSEESNENSSQEIEIEDGSKEESTNSEANEKPKKIKKEKRDKLKDEILELKAKNTELKNSYLKAHADLENTKKRLVTQAAVDRTYATQKILGDLLGPIDMLSKATNMETENPELKNFLIGFKMISDQLISTLESEGVKEIKAKAEKFDPKYHHAVSKEHIDDVSPDMVVEVIQTGYMYKDRVLRPAMVKVSE